MLGFGVFAACGFECVALASRGRVPTITAIVHRHRHLPIVELAVWAVLIAGWHHLIRGAGK